MNINEHELLVHDVQYARRGPEPGPGAMLDKDDDRCCVWSQEETT